MAMGGRRGRKEKGNILAHLNNRLKDSNGGGRGGKRIPERKSQNWRGGEDEGLFWRLSLLERTSVPDPP